MSRAFQIVFQGCPVHGTSFPSARYPEAIPGTLAPRHPKDPQDDHFLPPPDDPQDDNFLPPPDDPQDDNFLPPPDDPEGRPIFSGPPGACCCAGATSQTGSSNALGSASENPATPLQYSGFLIVRLREGLIHDTTHTLPELARALALPGLTEALERSAGPSTSNEQAQRVGAPESIYWPSRPLIATCPDPENFDLCDPEKPLLIEIRNRLRELEAIAARNEPRPGPSLLLYWRIDLRHDPSAAEDLLRKLRALPFVDIAYRELLATDPANDPANYSDDQSYLRAAPVGIDADWACQQLAVGSPRITLVDLEQRWVLGHRELPPAIRLLFGDNRHEKLQEDGSHGTAVLAQLAAEGKGVDGISSKFTHLQVVSHYDHPSRTNGHVAEAICHAVANLYDSQDLAGSILLLEVQRSGLPTEADIADATAIQIATSLGITVLEAAGNGGFDLDTYLDEWGQPIFRRGRRGSRDTGALLVGAAWSKLPHDRAAFSNFGSAVRCYGWGDSVTTAGYGDFDDGGDPHAVDRHYTARFSGTSSAVPCVAGAAVLVQALHRQRAEVALSPLELRELLANPATGTPQGSGVPGHIGVMPALRALFSSLDGVLPEPSFRRSIAEDGVSCREITCSSPDLVVSTNQNLPPEALDSPGRFDPAPGQALPARATNLFLHAVVRNRGRADVEVHASFFSSKIATFLRPLMWSQIGISPKIRVPCGGGATAIGPMAWTTDAPHQALLVTLRWPSAPNNNLRGKLIHCFDWDRYHQFFGRPEVACRNVHRVDPRQTQSFSFTGAPEEAWDYDFELLQDLPHDARIRIDLQKSPLLEKKLQNQHSWFGSSESLPPKPLLRFEKIRLAADSDYPAHLRVVPGAQSGARGLSGRTVILRQLLQGREIGRITWIFT